MGIVGCYTLELYCDGENKAHVYDEFPHSYVAETGARCRKGAKNDGWRLNRMGGTAVCPKCSRKRPKV